MPDPQPILNVVVPSVVGGIGAGFTIWVLYQVFKAWRRKK